MRLLIVGSLDGHIAAAGRIAFDSGAKVAHVDDTPGALKALRAGQGADLVMIDVKQDIETLVKSLDSERIVVPVVACGIGATPEIAANAIRAGAKEYVPLPPDAELIAAVLAAVAEEANALIFRDPVMNKVLRLASQVAASDASVLITGESGTGKEVMARFIHTKSKRSTKSFITVNCAAIPENLLESELFGHEKGSFTGAVSRRIGKFEEAHNGTLLLDEISEMHPRLQAKLLRAVQEREIDRVGGSQPIKVDIRLLATSNRDLEEEVRQGNFREDLYFRLKGTEINVPPLRERREDIPRLVHHFIGSYAAEAGDEASPITDAAMMRLVAYGWPGNVRELENALTRAAIVARGQLVGPDHLTLGIHVDGSPSPKASGGVPEGDLTLDGAIEAQIRRVLEQTEGNKTEAASLLGISRSRLTRYVERLSL